MAKAAFDKHAQQELGFSSLDKGDTRFIATLWPQRPVDENEWEHFTHLDYHIAIFKLSNQSSAFQKMRNKHARGSFCHSLVKALNATLSEPIRVLRYVAQANPFSRLKERIVSSILTTCFTMAPGYSVK